MFTIVDQKDFIVVEKFTVKKQNNRQNLFISN